MSAAADFLLAFTRAIATLSLYDDRHPTTMSAVEKSFERLHLALSENGPLQFSFLMNEVVCGKRAMRELSDWEWSSRLALAGVQRLEIDVGVTAEEYLGALVEIEKRLAGGNSATTLARPMRRTHIRYGAVGLPGQGRDTEDVRERAPLPTATISYSLGEEADAVRWIHGEMESSGTLALLEAEAVVRSLAVAMHGSGKIVIPLTQMKDFDQYTTTHSLNVAVLAMALAETLGFGAQDTRAFGTAGLLHDIGKVRVPRDILVKPGKLTESERAVLNAHPVDGARIILEGDQRLDLAATVAYEHHIMIDGGGYPRMHFRRDCHYASRVVHVCDVFDALCTDRPYRPAWEIERALEYIEERSGTEFDSEIASVFTNMMRRLDSRVMTEVGA
ncbi:MAG TPA: HD domain-containing phosphohydrolase [Gemmatimonadaceae bacterium]|jgi:putative nucleotidyltransferase with HDIG domain|nr:HD domain-containing phosphohydrolase [Gemmatimonadaceae bacterium]